MKNYKKLYKLKEITIKLGGTLRSLSPYLYFRYEESET